MDAPVYLNPDVSPWVIRGDTAFCEWCNEPYTFHNNVEHAHLPTCAWRTAHVASNRHLPESNARNAARRLLQE